MADSREVKKAVEADIWPKLRELGFKSFEGRVARRTHADRIDILEFVTFSSYETQRLRLKPGSFAIVLGCHLKYITNPIAFDAGKVVWLAEPSVSVCLLRGELRRRYAKPFGLDRCYWPVGVPGVPIEKVMSGAREVVLDDGMRWFEQFETPLTVYKLLEEREQHMSKLWGFGNPGGPIRHYMLGYAALAAGNRRIARKHLLQTLESGCFLGHARRMRADADLPRRAGPLARARTSG